MPRKISKQDKAIGAKAAPNAVDERYLVPALMRGLDILKGLSAERRQATLSEVADLIGITRSSTYRLLYTLEHLGFVAYDASTKTYGLGAQVLQLGYGYLAARDLVEVAMPHLVRLRDRTGWSAHLGELHGREVIYLARVATRRTVASTVHVGTRLPARLTAMGRVLLSGLTDADIRHLFHDDPVPPARAKAPTTLEGFVELIGADRASGFAVQNGVYEPGVASVAAPIRDITETIVAAVNVSAISLFTSDAELNGPIKAEVLATAAAISRDLGHKTYPLEDTQTA